MKVATYKRYAPSSGCVTLKQCPGPYAASWTITNTVLYYFLCQYDLPM